ncbi:hypothetical protein HO133_008007 [Letharia lupina]|uniref:Uncharacterized protein n=1 Tax=Letharia lupina TaxID=560253 RepID=A0A8H6FH17_9LECA|nr:uncharacterized protein HO133_008007 [Letharia lupina]KAF6228277.1 hypothetical protein HO133_008007 [Letharia lupina]
MPRGRTDQTRGMTERENFNQSYLEESAAGRLRGYDTRGYCDSDRGGPRIAGSRDYWRYAGVASRGYGSHPATREEDPSGSSDSSDVDFLAGDSVGPRSGGTRGHRGMVREDYDSFDEDSLAAESASRRLGGTLGHRRVDDDSDYDSLAGDSAGTRYAGTRGQRGQGPPHSRGTGPRYADRYADTLTEESADDEPDCHRRGTRGGVAASARYSTPSSRRRELSPSPRRGGMSPGGRAGSVDSLESEAELGERNPSLRHYGGQRAPVSYGRYDGGRDSARRRY